MRRRFSPELILSYTLLTLGSAVMLLPLAWMLSAALKPLPEVMRVPPTWIPEQPTLNNFVAVFSQFPIARYLFNTLLVSTVVVASVLLTSAMAGYALAKFRFRWAQALFLLFLTSLMIPFQVRMIPMYKMMIQADLVDTYLGLVFPWLVDAFGIFLMRQFMVTIPKDYIEAARIDGASEWRIFFRVVLPQAKPGLAALAIFTFTNIWEEYLWPLIMSGSDATRTLPVGLQYFNEQYVTNIHYQMAAASLAVAPMLIVFFMLQKHFVEGITLTGLK